MLGYRSQMCPVNSKSVTQWTTSTLNEPKNYTNYFFRASLPIYGTLFSKLKLHIYYISEFLMQITSLWASCSSHIMKFWAVIQISSVSDVMMDVHTSQINWALHVTAQVQTQWFTCVDGRLCVRAALLQVYSAWELHVTDGCFTRGTG